MVSGDALRIEGLRAVLETMYDIVPCLTAPETMHDGHLAMVVLDVAEEDDLVPLMATLRRSPPGSAPDRAWCSQGDPQFIQRVVASGAKGYLLHTATQREILMAVDVVADGSIWAPRKVLASLDRHQSAPSRNPVRRRSGLHRASWRLWSC